MERHCKNCNHMLYASHTHCAHCGAKWLEKRITMRNVAADFTDLYIGLDTKFFHTFLDLFKKPSSVINGYITGRRVYYMDAIRYLLLSLFITGIYVYVLKQTNVMEEYMGMTDGSITGYNTLTPERIEESKKFTSSFLDYQGVLLLFTIPVLALAGRITFWGKSFYNFTEHIVFYLYTYSHMVIFTTPISIVLIYVSPSIFYYWSFAAYIFLVFHVAYCYKRCFNLTTGEIILRSLISVIVLAMVFIALILLGAVLYVVFLKIGSQMGYDMSAYIPAQPS